MLQFTDNDSHEVVLAIFANAGMTLGIFLKKEIVGAPCFKLVYLFLQVSHQTFTCSKSTDRSTRKICEICSKLRIKARERRKLSMYLFFVLAKLVPENI